jgi:hypothetical protein
MNVKPKVTKTCPQCGNEFRRPPSQAKARFCGAACWFAHHAAEERACHHCGASFRGFGRRKFCSRACSGLALRQRVEWRCKDCGRTEVRTPYEAGRRLRCADCGAAYRAARLKGQPLPHTVDPLVRERWLGSLQTPEHRRQMSELMTGRVMATEKTRRGSARHFKALHFTVRSPRGVTYRVDNLAEFVRSNPQLFEPADVVNRSRKRRSYQSRASAGLRKLRAVVGTRLSWKGWTLTFGCRDELGRVEMSSEALRNDESN